MNGMEWNGRRGQDVIVASPFFLLTDSGQQQTGNEGERVNDIEEMG